MKRLAETCFEIVPSGSMAADTGADAVDLGALPEWDLTALYLSSDAPEIVADLARADTIADEIREEFEGKIVEIASQDDGGDRIAAGISKYEALQDLTGRIGSFSFLNYATDTSDPQRVKFFGDMREKLTALGTKVLFFTLELNLIEDDVLDKLYGTEAFAHFRPWVEQLRLERPYQLEERVEKLFFEKSQTGRGAFNRLFDQTMTALRFSVDGEELAIEPTLNLLTDADGAKRQAGAEALAKTFGKNIDLFTLITNTLAKDKEISDRWRGFEDVADSRHLANQVEREVVDALEAAVSSRYERISHRYYAMKAKWMGQDRIPFWDRNAPLPDQPERLIGWHEARETVLTAYSGFAPEMADIARKFFDSGWIDAPVREGKSPGAFAHPTVPSAHPFVMLNYLGKPRDVMTLAHELGHGVHQYLANAQGPLMASTPLTLAETASVFGEMLTFRKLLDATSDAKERKAMLAQKVEDMINTVVRQIAFYTFERRIHTARRDGELTSEQIGEIWLAVQRESLGDAIELKDGYETFWAYIPHFIHSPFYVYAYAFGDCLVNSLYSVYEHANEGFAEKYFDMLRAGGTKHHKELLAPFGLDASDPEFWAMGLKLLESYIDELEEMQ